MKLRKLFVTTIAAAVAVSAFGCGSSGAATSDQASESATSAEEADISIAEDDEAAAEGATDEVASTNPITNYEGAYKVENKEEFYMLLEALDETDGVRATIINSDPDSDYVYWELYGTIDESLKITYEEGMKCKIASTEDGEASEEIIYEDGTGSLQITDDKKVTWQDDKENAGADYVFAWDQELTDQINEEMAESEDVGDFQNPAMNWTGPYTDSSRIGRSMFIDAVDENSNDCTVTITDEEENGKVTRWAINGTFNEEKPAIEYKDAVKSTGTMDEEGNFTEEEKLYENGTGRLEVNENDGTIKWVDDIEDAGNGSIFVFSFEYGGFGTTGEEAAYEEEFSDDELADEDFTEEEEVEDEDLEYDVNEDENSNDTTVDETMEDE